MAKSRGRRRHSRRWFLGALGASAGAAGLAALGCGDSEEPAGLVPTPSTPEPASEPEAYPTYPSTPAPDPTRTPVSSRFGGTLRYAAAFTSDQVFDPHRTTSAALLGQQALVYSRLLTYESQADATLGSDLALGLPEQPDETTYIFHLDPTARWHDIEPLSGRRVTAGDVLRSIDRQRLGEAQTYPRKERWGPLVGLEVQDEATLVARTEAPFAGMLARFASPEGLVVPVDFAESLSANAQVGSGPFRWVEWAEESYASVARNEAWHGADDGPFLDGISTVPPRPIDELEADFRTQRIDAVEAGFPQAQELKQRLPDLREARSAVAQFYGMRFLASRPPYDDPRLRRAITVAIDRRAMLERFFHGSGTLNPWISAAVRRWSLPQEELLRQPGYLPGSGGRGVDALLARESLNAFLEEQELPDPIELLVATNVEQSLGMGTLIAGQLAETLDLNVQVNAVAIDELAQRLLEGNAPWAVGVDNGWIELDDWLWPHFHSEGSANTFVLRDEELDALIEEQRAEFAAERRQEIAYDAQRRLLELNVGANFVSEDVLTLFQPYVQLFPVDAGVAYEDRFAQTWIDRTHPDYL